MSATAESNRQALLDLEEKILKIANLQADTTLKEPQTRFEPWKVVISGVGAAGVLLGAGGALGALIARSFSH